MHGTREKAELFDKRYSELRSQQEEAAKEFMREFKRLYQRALPLIEVIAKRGLYFRHPSLKGIRTIHGPIVAHKDGSGSDIFVFDGSCIIQVNTYSDELIRANRYALERYDPNFDKQFAMDGISSLFSYVEDVIKDGESCLEDTIKHTRILAASLDGQA